MLIPLLMNMIPNQKVNAYLIFANMEFYGIDITDLPDLLSNRNPNSSDNEHLLNT